MGRENKRGNGGRDTYKATAIRAEPQKDDFSIFSILKIVERPLKDVLQNGAWGNFCS